MKCADCPYLSNATPKREVCCLDAADNLRRRRAEAEIVNRIDASRPPVRLSPRGAALGSTVLSSPAVRLHAPVPPRG